MAGGPCRSLSVSDAAVEGPCGRPGRRGGCCRDQRSGYGRHPSPAQQHQALLAIKGYRGEGEMSVGLLAERLLIAPHSATELVGRLVAAGYVSRNTDPGDKRRQTLALTTKADEALKRLTAIHLT